MRSALELALTKQRLQLEAAAQRDALTEHVQGLKPLFDAGDQARAAGRWLRAHPEVLAAAVAFLVATRADSRRFVWRWGKRGVVAWRLLRNGRRWLHQADA